MVVSQCLCILPLGLHFLAKLEAKCLDFLRSSRIVLGQCALVLVPGLLPVCPSLRSRFCLGLFFQRLAPGKGQRSEGLPCFFAAIGLGFLVPVHGLGLVFFHALALLGHLAQIEAGRAVAFCDQRLVPGQGLVVLSRIY